MSYSQFGWVYNPREVGRIMATLPRPVFASAAPGLRGSGEGKTILLSEAVRAVLGQDIPYPAQQIGCCVSRGFSAGTDILSCVEIAIDKQAEEFKETSHEAIYGLAREIGNFLQPPGDRGDGAVGAWAAKAVSQHGTISREVVGAYSDKRAGEWGWKGVPADIKAQIRNKVRTVSMVKSYEEARDSIANGYPVAVCSDQGFSMERDRDGFCRPQGTWYHCMLFMGIRHDKPALLCMNSWGMDNPKGPLALGQPTNTFWVDARTADRMLKQEDSWALCDFDGYPARTLPDSWSYSRYI